jgi:hypothetical protein
VDRIDMARAEIEALYDKVMSMRYGARGVFAIELEQWPKTETNVENSRRNEERFDALDDEELVVISEESEESTGGCSSLEDEEEHVEHGDDESDDEAVPKDCGESDDDGHGLGNGDDEEN